MHLSTYSMSLKVKSNVKFLFVKCKIHFDNILYIYILLTVQYTFIYLFIADFNFIIVEDFAYLKKIEHDS